MSDLETLAAFARTKSVDLIAEPEERRLWAQIANEIDGYLTPAAAGAGLFEATP